MRGNGLKGLPTEKVISTIIMEISMTEVGRTINAMDMEFTRTKKVRCIKAIGTTTNKKVMAKKQGIRNRDEDCEQMQCASVETKKPTRRLPKKQKM